MSTLNPQYFGYFETPKSLELPIRDSRVKFTTVSVRSFQRQLGDHPDCRVGPPLSIGWEFESIPPKDIDEYEETRSQHKAHRLSSSSRKKILKKHCDVTDIEIKEAEKEVKKISRMRVVSRRQSKTGEATEVFLESVQRKIKRTFRRTGPLRVIQDSSKKVLPLGALEIGSKYEIEC